MLVKEITRREQQFEILRALSRGVFTPAEAIAKETGLSVRLTTILLKEMAAAGIVEDEHAKPSGAGWALKFGSENDPGTPGYWADAAAAFFRAVCKLACISPHILIDAAVEAQATKDAALPMPDWKR